MTNSKHLKWYFRSQRQQSEYSTCLQVADVGLISGTTYCVTVCVVCCCCYRHFCCQFWGHTQEHLGITPGSWNLWFWTYWILESNPSQLNVMQILYTLYYFFGPSGTTYTEFFQVLYQIAKPEVKGVAPKLIVIIIII